MSTTIIRSTRSIRKLRETAREAIRAVRALEEVTADVDVFGRYVIAVDEEMDMDEVYEFLRLAREMHPRQELTLIVTARTGEDREVEDGAFRRGSGQENPG